MLNGSNWPSPMMPAFNANSAYCLYFFLYIMLFDWGVLNLTTLFVYSLFRKEQDSINSKVSEIYKQNLTRAFEVLDSDNLGFLSYHQLDELVEELYGNYGSVLMTYPTDKERYELIIQLDPLSEGCVARKNFIDNFERLCFHDSLKMLRAKKRMMIRYLHNASSFATSGVSRGNDMYSDKLLYEAFDYSDITDVNLRKLYRKVPLDHNGSFLHKVNNGVAMIVDSFVFDVVIDSILLIIAIVYMSSSSPRDVTLIIYLTICLLEMLMKLLVKGTFRYLLSKRNIIDGVLVLILFITMTVFVFYRPESDFIDNFTIRLILIVRLLMFPRNFLMAGNLKSFRQKQRLLFEATFKSLNHIYFLIIVTFSCMYCFASIGLEIYGGLITKQGSNYDKLINTSFGQSNYWPLNFNDFPSGFITLFCLLHVNNMHIIASGFTAVTSTWSEVFFAVWYAVGVLFLLNILIAFFLSEMRLYLSKVRYLEDLNSNDYY